MNTNSLPKLQYIHVGPNDHAKADYVITHDLNSILGYPGGIKKFLSDKTEINRLTKLDPMELKRYNVKEIYKAHLLQNAHQNAEAWDTFLAKEQIVVGITHSDFFSSFRDGLDECLAQIAAEVGIYEAA